MNTSVSAQNCNFDTNLAMTSLEIAELVESRHDNVRRTIETLSGRGVIARPQTEDVRETKGNNRSYTTEVYVFEGEGGKRDSFVVVAQLCPEFTARLVDRWQELEQQVAQPQLPQTMAEALRLAADQAERLEQQERALQEAAPKVAFANRVEIAPDAITVGQAAKTIGTGRTRLFSFLRHHGWVNRRNEPYQAKIEAGLMDVKVGHWEHPEKGLQENITALVTGKGLVRLQKLWEQARGDAA
ncbi:phage antirepressor KilAC domain-containing protein [Bisbaumannia pacifica]|uniref:Phage antirepressor KilAC domain-containing protein n=1 Tax=Bisbaumannia pacifica TaxID=77098 RepID=A0ABD4KWL7_9GAMM|nr:phage antirepressor KilAC domain-containing protein [Halomonas pacifica]MBH8578807.1 phage antirepressor KilAC domain-containing protein [Halomonas pacifica]